MYLGWQQGDLLNADQFSYTYDSANRLTQIGDGTFTTEYIYNGDGVRIAQIQDGLRTDYVQDVAAPLPQVLTARQGGTVSKYLRGLGLIGEQTGGTGPNAAPAVWQYHLPDALGSVRQLTDHPTGQLLTTQRFDPFGGLMQRTTDNGQPTVSLAKNKTRPRARCTCGPEPTIPLRAVSCNKTR